MSVTDSLCLSWTVYVCHRQSVSVMDSLCLSQTICDRHGQPLSVTDSLCLSWTAFVCHRQSVSVMDSLCLSQTVFFCHGQSMSVMYSLVSVIKKSLSVSNTFSGIFRAEHGQNIRDFDHNLSMRFEFVRKRRYRRYRRYRLSGPLVGESRRRWTISIISYWLGKPRGTGENQD